MGAVLGLLVPPAHAQFAVQPLQPSPPPPVVPGAPAQAPASPSQKPPAKAISKDPVRDGVKDAAKDAPKDAAKPVGKDTPARRGPSGPDGGKLSAAEAKAAKPAGKPAPMVKMGPPLSKAEVFGRSAPATVLLIAVQDNRWRTTLGVIVKPQGVVVTDSRLLSGVEKGNISGFLYDPSLASDEDPLMFLRAHKEQELKLTIVRVDPERHLLMLQLPELPPKKAYPYLDLNDTQGVNPGLDVVALRTRGAQTLAMTSGSIDIKRPDLIEIDPGLTVESAGAPLLSQSGRLLGICIYADKALHASGAVRPVEVVRDLIEGRIGGKPVAQTTATVPENPSDARNAVEAVRIGLGAALAQNFDKPIALRLHSEFVAAMALRGRAVVNGFDSVEKLNAILKGLSKGSEGKAKVISEYFPLLVTERSGSIWMKAGSSYRMVPASGHGVAAIDDQTGALYATDARREVMLFDESSVGKSWRMTGLSPAIHLKAGGGQLYAILQDGRVLVADRDGRNSRQLFPRSVKQDKSGLELSQGVLYVLSEGAVYRYRNKKWDAKLQPIASAMKKLIVRGDNWYGLDEAGRVFSSATQHYIDRDGNIVDLWGLGPNLLVLTRDNNRFFYNAVDDNWGPWTRW
ncbi:MAG: trypsin-like peptidase domain-containing protein [Myxococcales bacterium]|nr:trypsin-like peptidase domain-containing protein [Myxococcales bacterium]